MGQDVAFGFRQLARDPGFFALILITLALGMGANVAVFSVANAVVLSPLPYFEPERLVAIWEANLVEGKDHERVAPPNFADYRALEQIFEDAAAWWRFDANLTDGVGEAQRVGTVECTANLFEVLGVSPRLGSGFPMADRLYDEDTSIESVERRIDQKGRQSTSLASYQPFDSKHPIWEISRAFENRLERCGALALARVSGAAAWASKAERSRIMRQFPDVEAAAASSPNGTTLDRAPMPRASLLRLGKAIDAIRFVC